MIFVYERTADNLDEDTGFIGQKVARCQGGSNTDRPGSITRVVLTAYFDSLPARLYHDLCHKAQNEWLAQQDPGLCPKSRPISAAPSHYGTNLMNYSLYIFKL
jgi:hypothetical protein